MLKTLANNYLCSKIQIKMKQHTLLGKAKLLVCTLALTTSLTVSAQDMHNLVRTMPDSILPLLTRNNRLDFLDFIDSNMKAELTNRLGGKSEMTIISKDYTNIRLSNHSDVSIKLLLHGTDSIICLIRTYSAKASDSSISFFTTNWEPLSAENLITLPQSSDFLSFPDSLSAEERIRISGKIDIPFIKATLSKDNTDITFTLTSPLQMSEDNLKIVKPYIKEAITRRWNNTKFE